MRSFGLAPYRRRARSILPTLSPIVWPVAPAEATGPTEKRAARLALLRWLQRCGLDGYLGCQRDVIPDLAAEVHVSDVIHRDTGEMRQAVHFRHLKTCNRQSCPWCAEARGSRELAALAGAAWGHLSGYDLTEAERVGLGLAIHRHAYADAMAERARGTEGEAEAVEEAARAARALADAEASLCVAEQRAERRARGRGLYLVTLTAPTSPGDDPKEVVRKVRRAFRSVAGGARSPLGASWGVGWWWSSLETTIAARGALHPHFHVLVAAPAWFSGTPSWGDRGPRSLVQRASERPPAEDLADDLARFEHQRVYAWVDALLDRWAQGCERAGLRAPSREAQDVRTVTSPGRSDSSVADARRIAEYLVKPVLGAAFETASATTKGGRGGSRTPWQVLADLATEPNERDLALWLAHEDATHNVRRFGRSRGERDPTRLYEGAEAPEVDGGLGVWMRLGAESDLPVAELEAPLWRSLVADGLDVGLLASMRAVSPEEIGRACDVWQGNAALGACSWGHAARSLAAELELRSADWLAWRARTGARWWPWQRPPRWAEVAVREAAMSLREQIEPDIPPTLAAYSGVDRRGVAWRAVAGVS